MKPNLKPVREVHPNPVETVDDLFYWIHFSQSFVQEATVVEFLREDQRPFGFEPFDEFDREPEPCDCTTVELHGDLKYRTEKSPCCGAILDIAIEASVPIAVDYYQELMWIKNLWRGGICHVEVPRSLQSAGFTGMVQLESQGSTESSDEQKYCTITTRSGVRQLGTRVIDETENFCPSCGFQPLHCDGCLREKCRRCPWSSYYLKFVLELGRSQSSGLNWTNFCPVLLSTWNGDDFFAGESGTIVTGRLLQYLIDQKLSPFGYGPMAVEARGATKRQLEMAERKRAKVELRFDIER
ncbi:MAG: hypothetical protein ACK5OB_11470 [Pirellula sp.]